MDLIRCPQCAKEIPDVSRFCRRCGSAVAWGATATAVTSWAGLPRSAWDAARDARPPAVKRNYSDKSQCVKRGGGSAWAASAMIGVAAFMVVSHVHRATIGPMIAPRPAVRVSPVRTPTPPPQLIYPRSAVNAGDRRFYGPAPVVVPPTPTRVKRWDEDRYEPPGYRVREGPDRRGSRWDGD
jgi:hypothetical protein